MKKQIERYKMIQDMADMEKLRETIQHTIKIVHKRRNEQRQAILSEESIFRKLIRRLIVETKIPDPEESPHKSTGINVLEDLLKKIIPILEIDFKKLTTSEEQRASYRGHILRAVKNVLAPPRAMDRAGEEESKEKFLPVQEELDIDIQDEEPEEFIDVRGEKDAEKEAGDPEKESFTITGEDETGRDMAFDTFKRIESNIVDSWGILYHEEDKELFYDYLLTNFKLYFDKFEDELKANLPEPTTPEYEAAKASKEEPVEEEPEEEIF